MKTHDTMHAKGLVSPYLINKVTGDTIPFDLRHNTLSFDSAKAMAMAFGGDNSIIPNRVGIIYGGSSASFTSIGREQSWSELHDELKSKNCDIQVQSFSCAPTLKKIDSSISSSSSSDSSSDENSPGYTVTFHAHSDSVTEGVFGGSSDTSSGSGSSLSSIFTTGNYIYQAVLLNKTGTSYTVLARVSLAGNNGSYHTKPEDFEIAIDWSVKFL